MAEEIRQAYAGAEEVRATCLKQLDAMQDDVTALLLENHGRQRELQARLAALQEHLEAATCAHQVRQCCGNVAAMLRRCCGASLKRHSGNQREVVVLTV